MLRRRRYLYSVVLLRPPEFAPYGQAVHLLDSTGTRIFFLISVDHLSLFTQGSSIEYRLTIHLHKT